jgi:hypothetical protein
MGIAVAMGGTGVFVGSGVTVGGASVGGTSVGIAVGGIAVGDVGTLVAVEGTSVADDPHAISRVIRVRRETILAIDLNIGFLLIFASGARPLDRLVDHNRQRPTTCRPAKRPGS